MPQEHSVGIIIFNKDKYLLLHYNAGHWGYVKGKVEANEESKDTARRELQEETGIKSFFLVKDFQEKEEYFYKKEGKTIHKEVLYFLAETREEEITLSKEHTGYQWLSYQEAMHLLFLVGRGEGALLLDR